MGSRNDGVLRNDEILVIRTPIKQRTPNVKKPSFRLLQ